MFVANMFKSRCRLQAENLFLRHQLNPTIWQGRLTLMAVRLQLRPGDQRPLIISTISSSIASLGESAINVTSRFEVIGPH
jgi:hypothetical protein